MRSTASVSMPPSSDITLSVETIHDVGAFADLAPEWEALLRESEADGLFLTWEWLFTWWKHLSAGYELYIVLLRSRGELIALAPLALRHGSFRQLPPMPALQFLGSGVAGSDYLDLIVRRGHEAEAVRVLSEYLIESARVLSFVRMRPLGPTAALIERMRQQGWQAWQGPSEICPFVSLRGLTFESYLASLGSEHRYAFRRKLGRIERRHTSSFDLASTETERQESLAALFALHAQRWSTRGDVGAFSTQVLRDFHDELSRLALAAGWLRLWVLRLDGKPVAALYGFLRQRTFYFYQSGFDPAFARESVGLVLLGVAVRAAIEEGADELDMLHGVESYKTHWANATRELLRFELYAPGTRGFLEREATALTRKARRLTRAALEMGHRIVSKQPSVDHANSL
jgi:CelD/BcsL family acetyltransferase involved in cellulose biosynthesis